MAIKQWIETDKKVRMSYGREISQEAMELNFFNPLIGTTDRALIRADLVVDEKPGGTTRVYFGDKLTGDGGSGNDDFDDNIDNENIMYMDIPYKLYENSLKSKKLKIINKMAIDQNRTKFKSKLGEWAATKLDKSMMVSFTKDLTNIVACSAQGVHPKNDTSLIDTGDHFSTIHIDEAKERAKNGRDGNGDISPKLKPFKVIVKNTLGIPVSIDIYLMIIGPSQERSLRQDPLWIEAQKMAKDRGANNPLFTGELGSYNGVVVLSRSAFDHRDSGVITSKSKAAKRYIPNLEDYNGKNGIETEIGLFLGAQAGLLVHDEGFDYYEEEADMGRKFKVGIDGGLGFAKAKFVHDDETEIDEEVKKMFHNKDFATIGVISAV